MLRLPTNRAVSSSADRLFAQLAAHWIEASLLFTEDESVSDSDITDILDEELLGKDSGSVDSWELMEQIRSELHRRQRQEGEEYPLLLQTRRIRRKGTWEESPAKSYFLLVDSQDLYGWKPERAGIKDYLGQGTCLELISRDALRALFPCWSSVMVGFSGKSTATGKELISMVAAELELDIDVERAAQSAPKRAKDNGLDVILYRRFDDDRTDFPIMLLQCASGANWKDKTGSPVPNEWRDYLDLPFNPTKGFAVARRTALDEIPTRMRRIAGVTFDQERLLSAGAMQSGWLAEESRDYLIDWARPQVPMIASDYSLD